MEVITSLLSLSFAASAIATLIRYLNNYFNSKELKKSVEVTVEIDGDKVKLIASNDKEMKKILDIIRDSGQVVDYHVVDDVAND
ncbi:hypothetical protein BLD44_026775 [Mastigocladus laminosus UU774]|nr:hypothetical protein BLD44_026775 [Mastigocladus laminosus UU774]